MNRSKAGSVLIDNLPHDGVVEVACMIDRNRVHPTSFGRLPPQTAAICDRQLDSFKAESRFLPGFK